MKNQIFNLILISCSLFSCTSGEVKVEDNVRQPNLVKDTILVSDLVQEFGEKLAEGNSPLSRRFFDSDGSDSFTLKKGDTTYIEMSYKSDHFKDLNESYKINIFPLTNNFTILNGESVNQFKFVIDDFADSIQYDVTVSSGNYIFLSDRGVEESVFLCRQKMFPKSIKNEK